MGASGSSRTSQHDFRHLFTCSGAPTGAQNGLQLVADLRIELVRGRALELDFLPIEIGRRRMNNSQLLETNPQIADPPDIIVEPREDAY